MSDQVHIQTLAMQLVQAVNGAALLKAGQLIIHFDPTGKARKVEILQVQHLTEGGS